MMYKFWTLTSLFISAQIAKSACSFSSATSVILPNDASLPKKAPDGVMGTLTLEVTDRSKTRIFGEIKGLSKNGIYGFHIHEYGDISSDKPGMIDCNSAGGHYNPFDKRHGGPDDSKRHVGDLGNIESNKYGVATVDIIDPLVKLSGDTSVIGRSFVVHQNEDDLSSQPIGGAGGRIACGVIGIMRETSKGKGWGYGNKPKRWPTPEPTKKGWKGSKKWPTPEPTEWPTPEPTEWPTPEPTDWPTPEPTKKRWKKPKKTPAPTPWKKKTKKGKKYKVWPTPEPTKWPTPEPTWKKNWKSKSSESSESSESKKKKKKKTKSKKKTYWT